MKIELSAEEYQELEGLVEGFEGMFFNEEEVKCFEIIKKIVDERGDIDSLEEDIKKKLKWQLKESFEWLESFNVYIICKEKILKSF